MPIQLPSKISTSCTSRSRQDTVGLQSPGRERSVTSFMESLYGTLITPASGHLTPGRVSENSAAKRVHNMLDCQVVLTDIMPCLLRNGCSTSTTLSFGDTVRSCHDGIDLSSSGVPPITGTCGMFTPAGIRSTPLKSHTEHVTISANVNATKPSSVASLKAIYLTPFCEDDNRVLGVTARMRKIFKSADFIQMTINKEKQTPLFPGLMENIELELVDEQETKSVQNIAKASKIKPRRRGQKHFDMLDIESRAFVVHPDDDAPLPLSEISLGNIGANEDGKNALTQYLSCPQCSRLFSNADTLYTHRRKVHKVGKLQDDKRRPWACKRCPQKFKLKHHLTQHQRVHDSERPVICPHCSKGFKDSSNCNTHIRNVHRDLLEDADNKFECPHCSVRLSHSQALQHHIVTKHEVQQKFSCDKCSSSFASIKSLQRHSLKHTEPNKRYKCPQCDETFSYSWYIPLHVTRKHTKFTVMPFKCTMCGRGFTTRQCLVIHGRVHSGAISECRIDGCNKSFRSRTAYCAHVRAKHSGCDVKYICEQCERVFGDKQILKRHQEHVHGSVTTKRKRWPCEECGKLWFSESDMRRHMRTHTQDRPYTCSVCEKRFTQRIHLSGHLASCHNPDKPLCCGQCGNTYTLKNSLQLHMRKMHGIATKRKC